MSNQISLQANKLWQVVSAPTTAEAYQRALSVTGTILREAALLLWLVVCLVLVLFDWFWWGSIKAGQNFRTWLNSFESNDTNEMASQMGQSLLAAGKSSLDYTVSQARQQLGLTAKPAEPALPVSSSPSAASAASPPPPPAPEPAPAVQETPTATYKAPANTIADQEAATATDQEKAL